MNLDDDDDLTPSGAGSLSGPAATPAREPVATFTPTAYTHPADIWPAFGGLNRTTELSRGGSQGDPFGGYRPGRSIEHEHEPVDGAERDAQQTAQNATDFETSVAHVRAALRPGSLA